MAKLNQILMGLALLLCAAPLAAQSCYVQLDDATGLPLPPAQLSELEAAACELRDAFPVEFQNDFAVYDFGFYLHQEGFAGGVPEVFQAKVAEVESESAYFLLFGRQLSRGGGTSEVWVEVRLPRTGSFDCFEEGQFALMENSLRVKANEYYSSLGISVFSYAQTEMFTIQKLQSQIEDMVNCCNSQVRTSCSLCPTADEIRDFFVSRQYNAVPISIDLDDATASSREDGVRAGSTFTYFTSTEITVGNENLPIGQVLAYELSNALSEGINATGFCTSNSDFCDNSLINQVLDEFDYRSYAASINSHVWENPDTTKSDTLFIKFHNDPSQFTFTLPTVTVSASYWECGPKPLPSIHSGADYAITNTNGTYYGYHKEEGQWVQGDSVQYYRRNHLTAPENEHTWADEGAFRDGLSFRPSFKAWLHASFPKVFTTRSEDSEFRSVFKLFHIESALGDYEDVFDEIYMQFKYAGFSPPSSNNEGSSLIWGCDSKFGRGLAALEAIQTEVDTVGQSIRNRFSIHHNLDDLFTVNSELFGDFIDNPNLSGLPMWAFATIGGTQGLFIQVKSIVSSGSPCEDSSLSNSYDVEVLFTIIDNFGVGMSDGAKWWFPGLVEQWVLQHYRNYDCDAPPCYIPITDHTVQTYHKFKICF